MVFSSWIEAYVSIGRLTSFLSAKELQADAVKREPLPSHATDGTELVTVSGASFAWTSTQGEPTLFGIDLSVKQGELIAVVGRVGSGKSSLISGGFYRLVTGVSLPSIRAAAAVLGEMTRLSGSVTLRGSVAYVSQNPWLQGVSGCLTITPNGSDTLLQATVRENIVFGHRFSQEFYDAVLDACAIRPDLAVLVDGDEVSDASPLSVQVVVSLRRLDRQTEIGEKGVTLSGGQRARISLARAVYSRADVILFDDPLSAVDSHVAKHLFEQVIGPSGLLAGKARLLCTNNIAFVGDVDEVIMLRAGSIIERASPRGGLSGDTNINKLLQEFGRATPRPGSPVSDPDSEETAVMTDSQEKAVPKSRRGSMTRRASVLSPDEQKKATKYARLHSKKQKEHRAVGSVDRSVYRKYIDAIGVRNVILYLGTLAFVQFTQIMTNVWLKNWSQVCDRHIWYRQASTDF